MHALLAQCAHHLVRTMALSCMWAGARCPRQGCRARDLYGEHALLAQHARLLARATALGCRWGRKVLEAFQGRTCQEVGRACHAGNI